MQVWKFTTRFIRHIIHKFHLISNAHQTVHQGNIWREEVGRSHSASHRVLSLKHSGDGGQGDFSDGSFEGDGDCGGGKYEQRFQSHKWFSAFVDQTVVACDVNEVAAWMMTLL